MPPWLRELLGANRPGLQEAIMGVLGRHSAPVRDIHPELLGGASNPVQLENVVVRGEVPMTVRERAASSAFPRETVLPPVYAQTPGEPDYAAIMARSGILPEMRSEMPLLAERLYDAIFPLGYANEGDDSRHRRALRSLVGLENSPRHPYEPPREDAWRLYLGLPQTAGTFSVSEHQPSIASDDSSTYLSIPGFIDGTAQLAEITTGRRATDAEVIRRLLGELGNSNRKVAQDAIPGVMGDFTLSRGEDERGNYISYYDIWDLDRSFEGSEGFFGRPFEIYDRIYYDPETFEPLNVNR